MAHSVAIQNYNFKDSVTYTEDHISVQKIYMYGLQPKLNQATLEAHFGMYGHILRLQIFKPSNVPRQGRRYSQTGYVFFAQVTDAVMALHSRVHHLNGLKFHLQVSNSWHQPDPYGMPRHLSVCLPNTKPPPPPPVMNLNDLALPDQIHFARTWLRFWAIYQMAADKLHKIVDLSQFVRLSGAHVDKLYDLLPKTHAERLCDFLAYNCRNLKTMDVIGDNAWSGRMVKTLNLSNNPLIGDTLAKLPNSMESLTLNDCMYFEVGYLMKILMTFQGLKELHMSNVDPNCVEVFGVFIGDQRMLCNIAKLSELRDLTLPQIQSYGTLTDVFGSNSLQKVERLAVRHLQSFSEQAILKLFRACPKLSCLDCLLNFTKSSEQLVLPIELWPVPASLHANSEQPKDIIQLKGNYESDDDVHDLNEEDFDDYAFDPDDLDMEEDTDDEEFEHSMCDMGYLSDDDNDYDDDDDDTDVYHWMDFEFEYGMNDMGYFSDDVDDSDDYDDSDDSDDSDEYDDYDYYDYYERYDWMEFDRNINC